MRSPIGSHHFCGSNALSFDYYSGQNEVVVSFVSSEKRHGKGFKLEYRLAGCNRNYTSSQGRILNVHATGNCLITITVPENHTISLNFLTFIMFDDHQCRDTGFEVCQKTCSKRTTFYKILSNFRFVMGRTNERQN